MKAEEIREALSTWSQEDVLKLYTQTYRRVPKEVKEELDELIRSGPRDRVKAAKKNESAAKKADIHALEKEITEFIDNAQNGYYYRPNRIISKKERSNWRFTCKRFVKELLTFTPKDPAYPTSNSLLCRLYDILGYACGFYTFASQDPYHAIGYERQTDFFRLICERIRDGGDETLMSELIRAGCNGHNDRETVDADIHYVLHDCFEGEEERLREIAEQLFVPVKEKYEAHYKGKFSVMITEDRILTSDRYDSLAWFIVATYIWENRATEGLDYALKLALEQTPEISLYCVLMYYIANDEEWIRVYDYAVKKGIKPRDHLKENYRRIKGEA